MLKKILIAAGVTLSLLLTLPSAGSSKAEAHGGQIYVSQACSSNGAGVDVTVHWTGHNPHAYEQWVDVSQYYNGWVPQSYAAGGPISPNQSSYRWVGLAANSVFFVRVNQLMGVGLWDASETYLFVTGPGCAGPASYSSPYPGYAQPARTHRPFARSIDELDRFVYRAIAAIYAPPVPGHPLVVDYGMYNLQQYVP
jgi:hypothetical protein